MKASEQKRFDALYKKHLSALKLHGYSNSTIDVYSRVVRRVSGYFDCVPDKLTVDQLTDYFADWSIHTPGAPFGSIATDCSFSGSTF